MKRLIIILSFFFAVQATAQKDSVKVDSAQLFFKQVGDTLSLKSFNNWLLDNVSARKYSEYQQIYSAYMQQQYEAWLRRKK